MPKTITVTNTLRASYLADGPMVEMEFAGLSREKFALRFSPNKPESFVAQARQLILLAIVLNSVFAASSFTKQIRSKDRQSAQGR